MTERAWQPLGQAADEPPPQSLPLYADRVAAGFPSPAEDHLQERLDLNALLIRHPAATLQYHVRRFAALDPPTADTARLVEADAPGTT